MGSAFSVLFYYIFKLQAGIRWLWVTFALGLLLLSQPPALADLLLAADLDWKEKPLVQISNKKPLIDLTLPTLSLLFLCCWGVAHSDSYLLVPTCNWLMLLFFFWWMLSYNIMIMHALQLLLPPLLKFFKKHSELMTPPVTFAEGTGIVSCKKIVIQI